MNTKHTPGPWKFEKRGGSGRAAIEHNIPETDYPFAVWIPSPPFVMGSLGCLVCKTNGICPDESEANARLIAAAPDLLEALKTTQFGFNHRRCNVCAGWNMGPNGETDMIHTKECPVRKAIAKAEGK